MRKRIIIGGVALSVAALLALTAYVFANAPEPGTMGVWGYVADASDAQLEIEDQIGVDTLVVDRVAAPGKAWIVVHLDDDGMPGERVGLKAIPAGESLDVEVPLEGVTTSNVIVAVHADRGEAGEFDFDMEDAMGSPDRPYFVDGMELASVVKVR